MEATNMGSANAGSAFFLFALVRAYRAQTSGRNARLWFFPGLFFAPITGLVLLHKNSQDRRHSTQ